jgi:hypothetical protein
MGHEDSWISRPVNSTANSSLTKVSQNYICTLVQIVGRNLICIAYLKQCYISYMKSEVLTAVKMPMLVLWVVTPSRCYVTTQKINMDSVTLSASFILASCSRWTRGRGGSITRSAHAQLSTTVKNNIPLFERSVWAVWSSINGPNYAAENVICRPSNL